MRDEWRSRSRDGVIAIVALLYVASVRGAAQAIQGRAKLEMVVRLCISIMLAAAVMGLGAATEAAEPGRGLVSIARQDGVYLSWRLLPGDSAVTSFHLYRQAPNEEPSRVNSAPITDTTDFVDAARPVPGTVWFVEAVDGERRKRSTPVGLTTENEVGVPYFDIQVSKRHRVGAISFADVNGDGDLDYVVRTPDGSTDPAPRLWHRNGQTYQLDAYTRSGEKIGETFNMGIGIERGIWYAPFLAYDLDGDGAAEYIVKDYDRAMDEKALRDKTGRITNGPEYLAVIDPVNGQRKAIADWPSREGFRDYNRASRNQLGIAYLDGQRPHIIAARGTYYTMKADAFVLEDGELVRVWSWRADRDDRGYGQGAHTMKIADVDDDGKDEVILGLVALDDDGSVIWAKDWGHADHIYVSDFIAERPGLELYFGLETQKDAHGMGLLSAASGKTIWLYDRPTRHIHSEGMCADISASTPGPECLSTEKDMSDKYLWAANGERLERPMFGDAMKAWAAFWDHDDLREVYAPTRQRLMNYPDGAPASAVLSAASGTDSIIAVADILGDWREELIVKQPNGLRIYLTDQPAVDRRRWLFTDPIYHRDTMLYSMGYPQLPSVRETPKTVPFRP